MSMFDKDDVLKQVLGNSSTRRATTQDIQNVLDQARSTMSAIDMKVAEAEARNTERLREITRRAAIREDSIADLGTDSDLMRMFTGGVVKGTGAVARGIGELAYVGEETPEELLARDQETGFMAGLRGFGKDLEQTGKTMQEGIYEASAEDIRNSTPTGDLTDPSTWSLGKDASLWGYGLQLSGIAGEFAPVLAGNAVPGWGGAAMMAALGGTQAGAMHAEENRNAIRNMPLESLASSAEYQTLAKTNPGLTPEDIREVLAQRGGDAAYLAGGAVAALGGAATSRLISPATKLGGTSVAGKYGARVGANAIEEAVQESTETVAARSASNTETDTKQDVWENTFGDALLGGAFGAGMGAVSGVHAEVNDRREARDAALRDNIKTSRKVAEVLAEGNFDAVLDRSNRKDFPIGPTAFALNAILQNASTDRETKQKARATLLALEDEVNEVIENTLAVPDREKRLEQLLGIRQQVTATEEQVKAAKEALPRITDPAAKQRIEASIQKLEESLKQGRAQETSILASDEELKSAFTLATTLAEMSKVEATRAGADARKVAVDEAQPIEQRVQAVRTLAPLLMSNPDLLSEDELNDMLSNSDFDFEESERDYLQATLSEKQAMVALKSLEDVNLDILSENPSKGFRSLPQYRQMVATAVQRNNPAKVKKLLDQLSAFEAHHTNKANALAEAFALVGPGKQYAVVPDGAGNFVVQSHDPKQDKIVRSAGGWTVSRGSGLLVDAAQAEVRAIQATREALVSGAALSANPPSVRRTPATTPTQAATSPPATPQATPTSTTPVSTAPVTPSTGAPTSASTTAPAPASAQQATTPQSGSATLREDYPDADYDWGDLTWDDIFGDGDNDGSAAETPATASTGAPTPAATSTQASSQASSNPSDRELPAILTIPMEEYIAQQAKEMGLTPESPEYEKKIQQLKFDYLDEHERVAAITLNFEDFSKAMGDWYVPKVKLEIWRQLRTKAGLPTDQTEGVPAETSTAASSDPAEQKKDPFEKAYRAAALTLSFKEFDNSLLRSIFSTKTNLKTWQRLRAEAGMSTDPNEAVPAIASTPAVTEEGNNAETPVASTETTAEQAVTEAEETAPQEEVSQEAVPEETAPEEETASEEINEDVAEDNFWHKPAKASERIKGQLSAQQAETVNRATNYFKVSSKATLGKVNKFMSTVFRKALGNLDVLVPYLRGGAEQVAKIREAEKELDITRDFYKTMSKFNQIIDGLINKDTVFKYRTPVLYYLDENKNLPENLKTAISAAAYQYVAENGNSLWSSLTDDILENIFNVESVFEINEDLPIMRQRHMIGLPRGWVTREIGERAMQYAGLQAVDKNVPESDIELLKTNLGQLGIAILLDQKLFTQIRVGTTLSSYEELVEIYTEENKKEGITEFTKEQQKYLKWAKGGTQFIRSNRRWDKTTKDFKDNPELDRIERLYSKTSMFIDSLMSREPTVKLPTTEPVKFTQTVAKRSMSKLPQDTIDRMNKRNAIPHYVDGDLISGNPEKPGLFDQIPRKYQELMVGVRDENETLATPLEFKISDEGKDNALRRSLDNMYNLVGDILSGDVKKAFYYQMEIWRMGRIGYVAKGANPQQDKVARFLITMADWEFTVNLDTGENMDAFWLAIAEANGDKTNKNDKAGAIKAIKETVKDETSAMRIGAEILLNQMETGTLEEGDAAILAYLVRGKEKMHTYAGMVALAKYLKAERATDASERSFKTNLPREGDGVTNGPIILLLNLGLAQDPEQARELMRMGGLFTVEDVQAGLESYGKYAKEGGVDLYQRGLKEIAKKLKKSLRNKRKAQIYSVISDVYGNLFEEKNNEVQITPTGRNFIKNPITITFFGAGVGKVIGNMSYEFSEKLLRKLTSYNDTPEELEALNTFVDKLNAILPQNLTLPKSSNTNIFRGRLFKKAFIEQTKKWMQDVLGDPFKYGLKAAYGTVLTRRTAINKMAEAGSELYRMVHEMRQEQLLEAAKAPRRKNGTLYQSITQAQKESLHRELLPMAPFIHTPMSKSNKNSADYGLWLPKEKRVGALIAGEPNLLYQTQLPMTRAVTTDAEGKAGGLTHQDYGQSTEMAPPGVGTSILGAHSTDAGSMQKVMDETAFLAIHDAIMISAVKMEAMMQRMNGAFWDTVSDFSIAQEVAYSFGRIKTAILDENNKLRPQFDTPQNRIRLEVIFPEADQDPTANLQMLSEDVSVRIAGYIQHWVRHAKAAWTAQMTFLSTVETVSQYYVADGEYTVTPEQREKVEEKLAAGFWADYGKDTPIEAPVVEDASTDLTMMRTFGDLLTKTYASLLESTEQVRTIKDEKKRFTVAQNIKKLQQEYGNLRAIEKIFAKTGDLQKAVDRVFKDKTEQERADYVAFLEALNARNQDTNVKRLSDAGSAHVHYVATQLLQVKGINEETAKTLQRLALAATAHTAAEQDAANAGKTIELFDGQAALLQATSGDAALQSRIERLINRFLNSVQTTPAGMLGTPMRPLSNTLVQAFTERNSIPAEEFVSLLTNAMRTEVSSDRGKQWGLTLLAGLKNHIPKGLEVRVVSTDTMHGMPMPPGASNHLGWTTDAIYLKSGEFVNSGLNLETAMHELLHGVLQNIIDQAHFDEKHPAHDAVNDLTKIYEKVVDFLNREENKALKFKFGAVINGDVLSGIHELISWGMTNSDFQRDVLMNVNVPIRSKEKRGWYTRLVNGFRAMVDSLVKVMFWGTQPNKTNAMLLLIETTTSLMSQVNAQQEYQTQRAVQGALFQTTPDYTSEEIFDALSGNNDARVRGLLTKVSNELFGAGGVFKDMFQASNPLPIQAQYQSAQQQGIFELQNMLRSNGILMDEQEMFVVEQLDAAAQQVLSTRSLADREIAKIWREAKAKVTADSLLSGLYGVTPATATPAEKAEAERIHAAIFNPQMLNNGSSHLSRFIALGQVYEPLRQALQKLSLNSVGPVPKKLGERLEYYFTRFLNWLGNRKYTLAGTSPDQRLTKLLQGLIALENARKERLAAPPGMLDRFEEETAEAGMVVRRKLAKGTRWVSKTSNIAAVRATARLGTLALEDRIDDLTAAAMSYRNFMFPKKRLGIFMQLATEVAGETENTRNFYKLLGESEHIQNTTKQIIEVNKKLIVDTFDGELSKKDSEALTQRVLRTDASVLLDSYTLDEVHDFLVDRDKVSAEIDKLIPQFKQFAEGNYYLNQAELLGAYLGTEQVHGPLLMLNAHNIATMAGTSQNGQVSPTQVEAAVPLIDRMATLFALYHSGAVPASFKKLVTEQKAKGKESGVALILGLHRASKADALSELFDGMPGNMHKGYTKDIVNPKTSVAVMPDGDMSLKDKGWEQVGTNALQVDGMVNSSPMTLWVLKDVGLGDRVTTIMSYTGMDTSKGTSIPMNASKWRSYKGAINSQHVVALNSRYRRGKLDVSGKGTNSVVPVLDSKGEIKELRYLMTGDNKNVLLDRINNIEEVLPRTMANQFSKASTKEKNVEVIEELKKYFDAEYAKNPRSFVEVSSSSTDPEVAEAWRLLPEHTRKAVRQIWGQDAFMVPNILLDTVLGYRNLRLSKMIDFEKQRDAFFPQFVGSLLKAIFGDKAPVKVQKFEDMWVEIVKWIKDVVVIRNLTTFVGNVYSNFTQLFWEGVPFKDIAKYHREALEGIIQYQKDSHELRELQSAVRAEFGDVDAAKKRIKELEFEIKRNPVTELIEAGMFQTIMEDIDVNTDTDFSYKSRLVRTLEEKTEKVPQAIKTGVDFMFVGQRTPLYKLLFKGTQFSDFIARYTLYKHKMAKVTDPAMKEEVMSDVREAFVNYAIPTHQKLEWANRVGLMFFMRYFVRIQKKIYRLMRTHGGRGLALAAADKFVLGIPSVLDSSALGRIGNNPFDVGAFGLPGALDEPIPLKLLTGLLD